MATFRSKAQLGGNIFRQTEEGPAEVTATVLVPSGTAIAASDVFEFMRIGANHRILEVTFETDDIDTGTTATINVGYSAPIAGITAAAFLSASTLGQAGGMARVENGGSTAFAGGVLAPHAENITLRAAIGTGPAGNPATDRRLTLTAKITKFVTAGSVLPPYHYANRYSSAGVGTL